VNLRHGWEFSAVHASAEQIASTFPNWGDVAEKMQASAPRLWDLLKLAVAVSALMKIAFNPTFSMFCFPKMFNGVTIFG
jgi:hypothetical protein